MADKTHTRRRFLGNGAGAIALAGAAALGRRVSAAPAAETPATPAGAKRLTLGVASYTFKSYDLDQAIAMTRRIGATHLCLKSFHLPLEASDEQIAASIAKIKQAGLVPYAAGVIYLRDEKAMDRAFAYAKAAGFGLIVVSCPPAVLPLLDRKVRQHDIKAAIHNHGPGDKTFPTPLAVYEKIKGLDKRIGICHDVAHTQRADVDPVEATRQVADRLLDLHLRDVDSAKAGAKPLELGRGIIDFPKLFRVLLAAGYEGVLAVEHEKDAKDVLPGLAECAGYFRGVLAGLG